MRSALLLAAVALLLLSACHPKPGTKCHPGQEGQCRHSDLMLACVYGIWKEIPCRGPDGCWEEYDTNTTWCDSRLAHEGDACLPKSHGLHACDGENEHDILECSFETMRYSESCPESTTCVVDGEHLDCD